MLGLTRIALVLVTSFAYITWHGHAHAAYAKGDDDDDGDDGGDDKADKGDKPDSDSDSDNGEEGDDDKDQPPVTAGGLFTINTYPVSELQRPLTMTERITQVRVDIGTDLSAKGAFGTGGLSVQAIHGIKDNFSVIGGIVDAYNFKQFSFYAGFEAGIAYDVFDVRVAANLHRFAIPRFCGMDPDAPSTCDANSAALPSGNYDAGGTQFSIDLGFPIRYAFTPQIAVVALQTLISIDFNGVQRGNGSSPGHPTYCSGVDTSMTDANGNPTTADAMNCLENGAKPDLNPSVGFAVNPIPQLSAVVFGQLRVPDFDTSAGNFQIPVTARVQFSPKPTFDIGAEFTLINVAAPAPQSPVDNRFLSLFMQARI